MQPKALSAVVKKELLQFFASPIAYLFLAAFAAISLFVFFWGDAFFARNLADVRPLFEWMPVLLIFLSAALTMRMWSDERKTGTLEFVHTLPVANWQFVLGKFLACIVLLALALVLTLPLPITVNLMSPIDWGPVWSAYLATLLLGGTYIALGLFISAHTQNQIVSLMLTVLVGGVLYFLGSPMLTDLTSEPLASILRDLGTGSRFESIARGVLDVRDLYYYLSLIVIFLGLNLWGLERERWAATGDRHHHALWRRGTALVVINLLLANVWLAPLTSLRLDMTQGNRFSLSDVSYNYLSRLHEPLVIKAYFSQKTHPLLAPLVPQLKDLLHEYEVAGKGKVRVEFIDPTQDQKAAEEAASNYGIKPVPFQVSGRYQASVVNAYFNVVVSYGGEFQTLSYKDFIDMQRGTNGNVDVSLRNPEYDMTRAIKRVLYAYQTKGDLYKNLPDDLNLTAYVSDDSTLPQQLVSFRQQLTDELKALSKKADGKLNITWVDPNKDASAAAQMKKEWGFKPMMASLVNTTPFYFYLTLDDGKQGMPLQLPANLNAKGIDTMVETGVKHFGTGLMHSVALVTPAYNPMGGGTSFQQAKDQLSQNYNVIDTDLKDGVVPAAAEALLVMAPDNLDDKQRFAIDQYLMKGGTVLLSTSPYEVSIDQQGLHASKHKSGLEDWLKGYGISFENDLVMDPQNSPFPMPVNRSLGGMQVQEWVQMNYPYFVDVRPQEMNEKLPILKGLSQLTFPWASPIQIDKKLNKDRSVQVLASSSEDAWLSDKTQVLPQVRNGEAVPFTPEGDRKQEPLAMVVTGSFPSYYADKEDPLLSKGTASADEGKGKNVKVANTPDPQQGAGKDAKKKGPSYSGVISRSPDSARLILFASNHLLDDQVMQLLGSANGSHYTNSLSALQNTVDWSVEDDGLLSIRARDVNSRTLPAMSDTSRKEVEYLNYFLAMALVLVIFVVVRVRQRRRLHRYSALLLGGQA
ncbi:Gldg family protein [Pokkaliibacter sp. CJK22405]|uniref:Gldg family protein n=1 Tax=Pokkaliibacter sp. CJK22405 TaxID=3384615 RepID=UPI00398520F1